MEKTEKLIMQEDAWKPLKEMNLVELNESLRRKIPLEPITLTDERKREE